MFRGRSNCGWWRKFAGQAAVFLSQTTKRVHLLVRSAGLAQSMSRYLIRRIEETPNILLHTNTEIVSLEGEKSSPICYIAK